jgi:predicted nucleic acid-binding protein
MRVCIDTCAYSKLASAPPPGGWIAAAAMETGSRLVTYDAHFAHIPGLLVVAPQ